MNELEKLRLECETDKEFKIKSDKYLEDVLSFDYYNYKLENLVKKIKSNKCKLNIKACR